MPKSHDVHSRRNQQSLGKYKANSQVRITRGDYVGTIGRIMGQEQQAVFVAIPNGDVLAFPVTPSRSTEGSVAPVSLSERLRRGTKVVVKTDCRGHRAGRVGWLTGEPSDANIATVQFKGWCIYNQSMNCAHRFFVLAPPPLELL